MPASSQPSAVPWARSTKAHTCTPRDYVDAVEINTHFRMCNGYARRRDMTTIRPPKPDVSQYPSAGTVHLSACCFDASHVRNDEAQVLREDPGAFQVLWSLLQRRLPLSACASEPAGRRAAQPAGGRQRGGSPPCARCTIPGYVKTRLIVSRQVTRILA